MAKFDDAGRGDGVRFADARLADRPIQGVQTPH